MFLAHSVARMTQCQLWTILLRLQIWTMNQLTHQLGLWKQRRKLPPLALPIPRAYLTRNLMWWYLAMTSLLRGLQDIRSLSDTEKVSTTIASLDSSLIPQSIRDYIRLGSYKPNQCPRPGVLVKYRATDVRTILSKWWHLPSPIFIKQDLSQDERATESLLLKERRALIESGIERNKTKTMSTIYFTVKSKILFFKKVNQWIYLIIKQVPLRLIQATLSCIIILMTLALMLSLLSQPICLQPIQAIGKPLPIDYRNLINARAYSIN